MEFIFHKDVKVTEPYEYWCYDCKKLRLSVVELNNKCGSCGGTNILKGQPGELDKEALQRA